MDIGNWLRSLGLERYEQAFLENEIDEALLPSLTAEDLKDLGVTLVGHRRRLLDAIAVLALEQQNPERPPPSPRASEAPISVPRPQAVEAERRQLTVMFVDLAQSTELSRRLDPEEMRDVIHGYQNTVAGEVTRFEGTIAKFMGDGVLAYFGWPRAHEHSAERAVRAGLAVAGKVAGLRSPAGEPLAARVGIATGLVVVGDLVGEGAAQEEAVVGDTPNLAARMQAIAAPGEVVVATGTIRLLGQLFDLKQLPKQEIKGFAEGTAAYRVVGESSAESRFEALRTAQLSSMFGREHELGFLLDRWQLASAGEGQVVQLVGEPGIGKSRILQSLRESVAAQRRVRLRYYCSPYHINSALYPVIVQLGRAAGLERDDDDGAKLDKLERLLATASDLNEVMPVIASLLSIATGERYPPTTLSPQRQKARIFEILFRQLEELVRHGPVLMIIEDMHWMDPTSLDLFDEMVGRIERMSVLLIASYRPEIPPRWTGFPHVSTVTLTRLGRAQAAAIVAAMTGGRELPQEVLDHILARSDGVPLFVEELTKVVLESGLLHLEGRDYALRGSLPALAIPTTLQDSLMARLDRLAPVKEVAQIGAVIGREFAHELLEEVAAVPEAELVAALDQLVEAELIFRRGRSPKITYSFKHALVQDAAYRSLLRTRRQILHAKIGKALVDRFPQTVHAQPEVVAHHFTRGGLVDQAVDHWKKAGQLAMARSATAEAIAHLNAGLDTLMSLPESEQRDRQELGIQLAMGSAMVAAYGFAAPATGKAYKRAREICERLEDIRELFPVLYGLCLFHLYAADLTSARAASDRLLELAECSNDRGLLFFAHRAAGVSRYPAGDLLLARTHLERALELYDPNEHAAPAFVYAFHPRVVCLDYLARTLFPLGLVQDSLERNHEAVAQARRTGHRNSLALPLFFGATLRQLIGDRDAVLAMVKELGVLAEEEGFRFWLAGATILRGWAAAEDGELQAGIGAMEAGILDWQATGADYMLPYFSVLLAQARMKARHDDEVAPLIEAAVRHIERSSERWFEAEVHRTAGVAALQSVRSRSAAAEASFQRAVDIAREQNARLWELRAATDLASLWVQAGRSAEARELLAPLCADIENDAPRSDVAQAKRVLSRIGAAS